MHTEFGKGNSEIAYQAQARKREGMILAVMLVLFLLVNLVTAERSPTVWIDEVSYTDPAVNLVREGRFSSTAWLMGRSNELWAGNVPLHSILLSGWLAIWGLSPTAVRSLNYIWVAVAVTAIWAWARRTQFISTTGSRLTLVALMLNGYGMTFSYRSGRPDMLGFVLLSLIVLTTTTETKSCRLIFLYVLGFCIPWAGLQLLPFSLCLLAVLVPFAGLILLHETTATFSGVLTGLVGLYVFYLHYGVWKSFVASIAPHISTHASALGKLVELPTFFLLDYSAIPLVCFAIVLGVFQLRFRRTLSRTLGFALVSFVSVPLALGATGKYPVYYTWMTYAPFVIGMVMILSQCNPTVPPSLRWLSYVVVVVAILLGLPARVCVTGVEWSQRSYQPITELIQRTVKPSDNVCCDYCAYYAVKPKAHAVYLPSYYSSMTDNETRSVSVVLTAPTSLAAISRQFGGVWERVDGISNVGYPGFLARFRNERKLASLYVLDAYRRAAQ